ncbi:MAG TPA: M67 family metallopeptidase [Acidimicrobiales bacterium]|nr:M67 family metallopeptidase [Acidimicrobiales bacterium]
MLRMTPDVHAQLVGHAYDGLPLEACGLLGGDPATGDAQVFYPCRNTAESSRVYTVDPMDHLRADRDAESRGLEIIGVVHSHTHTTAYPSPTDVAQAPDPGWHYVIVSLRDEAPSTRSYRIVDGNISEEPVVLLNG